MMIKQVIIYMKCLKSWSLLNKCQSHFPYYSTTLSVSIDFRNFRTSCVTWLTWVAKEEM